VTVVDRIREWATEAPQSTAILADGGESPDRAISYADLVRLFEQGAERIRRAGVSPGDRVGLVARQGAGFIEAALGVLAADACMVPIPDDTRGAVLDEFVARAHLHHLMLEDEEFVPRAISPVVPVDGNDDADFRALRPAYLRFTSGTTSERKGVILGHDAIEARLAAANRALAIGPGDRILWLLPMAHHFVVSILLYLRYGATVLLPASSLARTVLDFCQRAAPTVLYASPHHFNLLAKDASEVGLPDVRLAISTAEGLRGDIAERFRVRFGIPLGQALGIIEVGLPVVNASRTEAKPEALGRPLPDFDVWLRDEEGKPVTGPTDPAHCGEICIRGPGLFDAYLEPWSPAFELLEPDGFRTGDQGWFDAEGDLHLAGRRKNRINMAGMKFFSEEVETVLDGHPAIARSRVFARRHDHLGEIPVAEIVLEDPALEPSRKELTAHCRERLPSYKIPRAFQVVDELALTETGKVARS
jgi:long-chain acyl-CoA synthetase